MVKKIKAGQVLTYQEVARQAGNSKAARAVGKILNSNTRPDRYPCHRVIKSNGSLGGYRWGIRTKIQLLKKEGWRLKKNK